MEEALARLAEERQGLALAKTALEAQLEDAQVKENLTLRLASGLLPPLLPSRQSLWASVSSGLYWCPWCHQQYCFPATVVEHQHWLLLSKFVSLRLALQHSKLSFSSHEAGMLLMER